MKTGDVLKANENEIGYIHYMVIVNITDKMICYASITKKETDSAPEYCTKIPGFNRSGIKNMDKILSRYTKIN